MEDQVVKALSIGALFQNSGNGKITLAAAMVGKTIGENQRRAGTVYISRFGNTVDEIFISSRTQEKYGSSFDEIPAVQLGLYYFQRLAQEPAIDDREQEIRVELCRTEGYCSLTKEAAEASDPIHNGCR